MTNDVQKNVALLEELRITVQILDEGLSSFKRLSMGKDHYYPVFLLLSNGFERLFKTTIVYHLIETEQKYPEAYPWRGGAKGHDLERLRDYIVENCFPGQFANPAIAEHESSFLSSDPVFTRALNIISRFGVSLRYANLDRVAGKEFQDNPENLWSDFETDVLKKFDPKFQRLLDVATADAAFEEMLGRIHDKLKYSVAAVSRLYTLGGLSPLAKQASPQLLDYYRFGLDDTVRKLM